MLNPATNVLFGLTGLALALAVGYAAAGGERTGLVLLLFLGLAALLGGLATLGGAVPDRAPPVPDDAPPPEPRATTPGAPVRGSAWPLAAAAAVSLLAAGAAIGIPLVLVGVGAVLVATAGWFARVWSEHPSWTRPVRERVSTRLLVPVGLPLAAFGLAAVIAVSASRIFLAIPEKTGGVPLPPFVALVLAVAILGTCAWVASRPRLGSSALIGLSVLAGASLLGAGIAGAVSGEREFHHHKGEEKVVRISAKNLKFDKNAVTVPARERLVVEFENDDEGIYHNVAVYAGEGLDAAPVFNGEGFPGHEEKRYELETPAVGRYTFICDFHPTQMKGEFVTEEA